ncbi:putative reverse transcriptase domain-containing protein [Tanacetum coccineum]
MVTYTEVSSPFEDLSDIGSLKAIVYGYDGLPMMLEDLYAYVEAALQASPSPDYVPSPEEPEQAPPSPDFVPELVNPEFMPPEDDVLLAKEQPLPAAVSPTADSPGYITESNSKEDPKEDDEDPKEDPADYPTDRNDDDDEEEEDSSEDDVDDKEEDEDEDEEEEEEHLASADSVPPPVCHTTAIMSIRDQTPISFLFAAEVDRFLAISTPPPLPLTSYTSPLPHIPSLPLPVSSPLPMSPPPLLASPTHPLGYRAAMIRLRAELPSISHPLPLPSPIVLPYTKASIAMMRDVAPSTYILASRSETPPLGTPLLLPIPLPTSSPPLLLPSTDYRADVPEVEESSSAPTARPNGGFRVDYGFVGTLDAKIRRDPEKEIGYGITDIQEDPDEIVKEIPASGRVGDRCAHARTARLMETEARASCEDWVQSMDASDTTCFETQMAALQSLADPARIQHILCTGGVVVVLRIWMFPKESNKIERYVGGLPDMIHGSVMASKLKTIHDAIEFATELMDKKIRTFAERQSEKKGSKMITNNNRTRGQKAACFECGAKDISRGSVQSLRTTTMLTKVEMAMLQQKCMWYQIGVMVVLLHLAPKLISQPTTLKIIIEEFIFMSASKLNDLILWHARLCHIHFKRMQDMSKDGLILAFDMDIKKCKTCMLNKITKKPFQNVKRKTEVLELIHSDLCDLHATPSLGNKKYFVTFIDDALRFYYVYLLHLKDKALDKFKVFKIVVELQQGSLIKRFRTDKGVPRPSLGILNGTEDIGGSVVPEEVTKEVVQQPKPELKKSKRNRTPMNFEPKCAFLRSSPKHNLTSSCNGSPSCALVKKYTISEFAEALTPL